MSLWLDPADRRAMARHFGDVAKAADAFTRSGSATDWRDFLDVLDSVGVPMSATLDQLSREASVEVVCEEENASWRADIGWLADRRAYAGAVL